MSLKGKTEGNVGNSEENPNLEKREVRHVLAIYAKGLRCGMPILYVHRESMSFGGTGELSPSFHVCSIICHFEGLWDSKSRLWSSSSSLRWLLEFAVGRTDVACYHPMMERP